ncbi:MAG: GntR family transcriptional regulator [Rhodoglobus sp.]
MTDVTTPAPSTRDGNSSSRIANRVRAAILGGEYPPGSRIRQEDLAARFGASRVPVREALRILESDGLITVVANTGAWVTRLNLDECTEIYQIRERIEPLLLRMSIPGLREATLDTLDDLSTQMTRVDSVEEFLRLDREFHLTSYVGADTAQLGDLVGRLWNTTQPYRRAYTRLLDPDSNRIVHDEHHMLVLAMREQDTDAAEQVLAGHIRRTRLHLARHPEIFSIDYAQN